MEFKDETEQLIEFYKSLSHEQAVQFMGVIGSATMYGEDFVKAGIKALLIYELKLPSREKD